MVCKGEKMVPYAGELLASGCGRLWNTLPHPEIRQNAREGKRRRFEARLEHYAGFHSLKKYLQLLIICAGYFIQDISKSKNLGLFEEENIFSAAEAESFPGILDEGWGIVCREEPGVYIMI